MTHVVVSTVYFFDMYDSAHRYKRESGETPMVVNVPSCLTSTEPLCRELCHTSSRFLANHMVDVHVLRLLSVIDSVGDDEWSRDEKMAFVQSNRVLSQWSKRSYSSFVITPRNKEEITNICLIAQESGLDYLDDQILDDNGNSLLPTHGNTLLHTVIHNPIGVAIFELAELCIGDVFVIEDNTEDGMMDEDENPLRLHTVVLRPQRGWMRVRHILRLRAIVVYWLFLTEKLMAPGGSARKKDYEAFDSDIGFD